MLIDILNKLLNKALVVLLLMSIFNVIRHLYYFIQAWVRSDSDNPVRYVLNNKSLYILSISLAYVIATILMWEV